MLCYVGIYNGGANAIEDITDGFLVKSRKWHHLCISHIVIGYNILSVKIRKSSFYLKKNIYIYIKIYFFSFFSF
jgi:hypothetical protein